MGLQLRISSSQLLALALAGTLVALGAIGEDVYLQRTRSVAEPKPPVATNAPKAAAAQPADPPGRGPQGNPRNRWRDTGVYVDGKPTAMLSLGELPISMNPVWIDPNVTTGTSSGKEETGDKLMKELAHRFLATGARPAKEESGERLMKELAHRFLATEARSGKEASGDKFGEEPAYRFVDLLKAVGVELGTIKEIHVYGPEITDAIIATGAELKKYGQDFMFRFSGRAGAQPRPMVPQGFGNGQSPERITGVMVYVHKRPPQLVQDDGFKLNGEPVTDVPYFGAPLRGGVHVYLDDKFAMLIKRRIINESDSADLAPDGTPVRWHLLQLLQENGVDPSSVNEAWAIYNNEHTVRFSKDELHALTFQMGEKGNEILLGDNKIPASAIALHRDPATREQISQVVADKRY
jgi:hypothetical protein